MIGKFTFAFFVLTEEIEDMNSRFRVTKQRIADLERSVASVNSSSQQYEKVMIGFFFKIKAF